MILQTLNGHTVIASELSARSVILDLGANKGAFAHAAIAAFKCRCHCVEPNPQMFAMIPKHGLLTASNLAIGARNGTMDLNLSENPEASSLLSSRAASGKTISVQVLTLPDLIAGAGLDHVDLIKFDIEGAEIEVLDACSDAFLQGIPQLTIEFHDFLELTPVSEVRRVVERLSDLGFAPLKIWRQAWGDTLLINRRLTSATSTQIRWARHVTRNWWGVKRVVARTWNAGRPSVAEQ